MNKIINDVTENQIHKNRDHFKVGDGVRVHSKVREGNKERIQIFAGIVIALKGSDIQRSFTVRRIASGVGVERVFPVHSPNIDKIEVDRTSVTMRSKLYYLRNRVGKAAVKVKEKRLVETN